MIFFRNFCHPPFWIRLSKFDLFDQTSVWLRRLRIFSSYQHTQTKFASSPAPPRSDRSSLLTRRRLTIFKTTHRNNRAGSKLWSNSARSLCLLGCLILIWLNPFWSIALVNLILIDSIRNWPSFLCIVCRFNEKSFAFVRCSRAKFWKIRIWSLPAKSQFPINWFHPISYARQNERRPARFGHKSGRISTNENRAGKLFCFLFNLLFWWLYSVSPLPVDRSRYVRSGVPGHVEFKAGGHQTDCRRKRTKVLYSRGRSSESRQSRKYHQMFRLFIATYGPVGRICRVRVVTSAVARTEKSGGCLQFCTCHSLGVAMRQRSSM